MSNRAERVVIEDGLVIDPESGFEGLAHVDVRDGQVHGIRPVGEGRYEAGDRVERLDARGCWVVPGLIDLRANLREPGEEWKETVASGALAAVAGGFTSVCAMPDTVPINDEASVTTLIRDQGMLAGLARVYPVAAATRGQAGETLADIGDMRAAGAVAVSNGDRPIRNARLMRRVLEYARTFDLPVLAWSMDAALSEGGQMHEGLWSTRLGLPAIPSAAEVIGVARDLSLAELTKARLHLGKLSAAGSIPLLLSALERGLHVTAEVTPHHLTLTDEVVRTYDTNTKVRPPLREEPDRQALLDAVAQGVITCIATDHAPQNEADKALEYEYAQPGIVGLETALPLVLRLVRAGALPRMAALRALTAGPAKVIGIDAGRLAEGSAADIAIIDPEAEWVLSSQTLGSLSHNTPLLGETLIGRVRATLVGGRVVFRQQAPDGEPR